MNDKFVFFVVVMYLFYLELIIAITHYYVS